VAASRSPVPHSLFPITEARKLERQKRDRATPKKNPPSVGSPEKKLKPTAENITSQLADKQQSNMSSSIQLYCLAGSRRAIDCIMPMVVNPGRDKGKRPNDKPGKWTVEMSNTVREGDNCFFCLQPTNDDDHICDNGRDNDKNPCELSFHASCYLNFWKEESKFQRCPCRYCIMCGQCHDVKEVKKGARMVDKCKVCDAHVHYACSKNADYYCPGCNHPVWDAANY
jgi:hypothetical protein